MVGYFNKAANKLTEFGIPMSIAGWQFVNFS